MLVHIDLSALLKSLSRYQSGIEAAIEAGLTDAAEQGAAIARTALGKSGELAKNTVAYKNSALDQGIIANKFYASWVEYGNGSPGSRIYPTKSSCLHFFVHGQEIFAKWVRASKPRPFMATALIFEQNNASEIVKQHIDSFLKG